MIETRFWDRVLMGDGCWPWAGKIHVGTGYGVVYAGGGRGHEREERAHRVAWALTFGPIPPGLSVLHKCDNPPCVNPDHLYLGTHQDNMADVVARGRGANASTHYPPEACPQGHAY